MQIQQMASGNLSLVVAEGVSWESFPQRAQAFLQQVGGFRIKTVETPVDRMWIVLVRRRPFFLAYEDILGQLTLDAMHSSCNRVVRDIFEEMGSARDA
jgi:hypothetical protein